MVFERTQEAIGGLAANSRYGLGEHFQDYLTAGQTGMPVGEVEYDPMLHDPVDIMIDSIMEPVTGQEHVQQEIPVKPFHFNVVFDGGQAEEHPEIAVAKLNVRESIQNALINGAPSPTDTVGIYHYNRPTAVGDRLTAPRDVLELCASGLLTYLISDFNRDLEEFAGPGKLDRVVAVKVNHQTALKVPRDVGTIIVGRGLELDTSDAESLSAYNHELEAYHQGIRQRLFDSGANVVQVGVSPKAISGFDIDRSDEAIAEATEHAYGKSKH